MARRTRTIDDPHDLVRVLATHGMYIELLSGDPEIRHSVQLKPLQGFMRGISYHEVGSIALTRVYPCLVTYLDWGERWSKLKPLEELPQWAQLTYLEGMLAR